jgi:hypothetical protein
MRSLSQSSGEIYSGQALRVILDTDTDISTATSVWLCCRYPSGASTVMTATTTSETKIYKDLSETFLTAEGKHLFRAKVKLSTHFYYSKPVHVNVRPTWYPYEE